LEGESGVGAQLLVAILGSWPSMTATLTCLSASPRAIRVLSSKCSGRAVMGGKRRLSARPAASREAYGGCAGASARRGRFGIAATQRRGTLPK
jgi:hypothetical protein